MMAGDPWSDASTECEAALERLELFLDHECPPDLEAAVRQHIADCPPCLDRTDFEARLREIVADRCKDAAPSGLLDRVISQLRES